MSSGIKNLVIDLGSILINLNPEKIGGIYLRTNYKWK